MTARRGRRWCLAALVAVAGCIDDAPGATDAGAMDAGPPTWDGVRAVMQRSCVFSACHGGRSGYPSLGAAVDYDALVGAVSREVPALRLVAPGDPAASWLMIKLDGTMASRTECRADPEACGGSMPQGVPVLARAERDLVREWIRLGAPGPRDP